MSLVSESKFIVIFVVVILFQMSSVVSISVNQFFFLTMIPFGNNGERWSTGDTLVEKIESFKPDNSLEFGISRTYKPS